MALRLTETTVENDETIVRLDKISSVSEKMNIFGVALQAGVTAVMFYCIYLAAMGSYGRAASILVIGIAVAIALFLMIPSIKLIVIADGNKHVFSGESTIRTLMTAKSLAERLKG